MLGIRGGLNTTWITAQNSDPKFVFTGGGFARFNLNRRWFIQPEVLYSYQGGKLDTYIDWAHVNLNADFRFKYLQVPVLMGLSLSSKSKIAGRVYAGPILSVALSSRTIWSTEYGRVDLDMKNTKSTDFGLVLGGGLDIDLSPVTLLIDLRFTAGLTDFLGSGEPWVNETEVYFTNEDGSAPDIEHGAVALTVGVGF